MPRRLELSDKGLELLVYLAMHQTAVSGEQIAQALWPRKSLARGIELVEETTEQVNAAIAEQTGNPTPVIPVDGIVPLSPGPRLQVNVLGEVCVEFYGDDEPFPGRLDDLGDAEPTEPPSSEPRPPSGGLPLRPR